MQTAFAFDIETGPLPQEDVVARSKPFKRTIYQDPGYTWRADWKHETNKRREQEWESGLQERLKEHAKAQDANHEAYVAKLMDGAPLKAHLGQVLAISYWGVEGGTIEVVGEDGDETSLLKNFWLFANIAVSRGERMIGFNIKLFDLPFLMQRSVILGVKVPIHVLDRGRYLSAHFVDVMENWSCGTREMISLNLLARAIGLEGKKDLPLPFHELLQEEPDTAREYAFHDARLAYEIHGRMNDSWSQ